MSTPLHDQISALHGEINACMRTARRNLATAAALLAADGTAAADGHLLDASIAAVAAVPALLIATAGIRQFRAGRSALKAINDHPGIAYLYAVSTQLAPGGPGREQPQAETNADR